MAGLLGIETVEKVKWTKLEPTPRRTITGIPKRTAQHTDEQRSI